MKEVIQRLHELLKNGLTKNAIKEYYIGVPDSLNDSLFPCLASELVHADAELGMTQFDRTKYSVDMFLFVGKKKGIATQHNKGSRASYEAMLDLVGGLDTTNEPYSQYRPDTIMGILRHHLTLQGDTTNTGQALSYINTVAVEVGPSDTNRTFFQVRIRVEITLAINTPNRQ